MTKIIFMGTPAFSATVLEGLLTDEHYDLVAVVTQQIVLSADKKKFA